MCISLLINWEWNAILQWDRDTIWQVVPLFAYMYYVCYTYIVKDCNNNVLKRKRGQTNIRRAMP